MKKISADLVYPVSTPPIENGVVITDENGKILKMDDRENHDLASIDIRKGVLTPGFINTHCHLELSHMKGKVETGTGLLPFLQKVVAFRDIPQEEILSAIANGDQEMYHNGIVAVGDISNKVDTADQKSRSTIKYYTFVEMFDFMQDTNAQPTFEQYKQVYDGQSASGGNRKSCVPHAPYTVSPSLFNYINGVNQNGQTVSIHNQETIHENDLFLTKTGGFKDFYQSFGISLENFNPTNQTSIHYAMQYMDPSCKTIFVHNTMTLPEDIRAAQNWNNNIYWATCPNANLYIENRLPNYQYFLDNNAKVTIGTDSLTSNWGLSILEEMKVILRFQSYVSFETVLKWATLNGAEALGYEGELGSLEEGKIPGINLISTNEAGKVDNNSRVERLI